MPVFLFLFLVNNNSFSKSSQLNQYRSIEVLENKSRKKRLSRKQYKKTLRSIFKNVLSDPETKKEKKKLPFGTIALISLLGIPLGTLIGTGIGNIFIFIGWFMAVLFGIRSVQRDENKFLGLIALAIAVGLLISTITFLESGLLG